MKLLLTCLAANFYLPSSFAVSTSFPIGEKERQLDAPVEVAEQGITLGTTFGVKTGNFVIWGRGVDAYSTFVEPTGETHPPVSLGVIGGQPVAASDGTNSFVLWMESGLVGKRLNSEGAPIDGEPISVCSPIHIRPGYFIAWDGIQYVVAWSQAPPDQFPADVLGLRSARWDGSVFWREGGSSIRGKRIQPRIARGCV